MSVEPEVYALDPRDDAPLVIHRIVPAKLWPPRVEHACARCPPNARFAKLTRLPFDVVRCQFGADSETFDVGVSLEWKSGHYVLREEPSMTGYAADYVPQDRAKFDEMLRDARRAQQPEHLDMCVVCWVLDPSYPRQDIVTVQGIVERERGWQPHQRERGTP